MTQSLTTEMKPDGLHYIHSRFGHIATKVFHSSDGYWGLVPQDGLPAKICARICGNTAELGSETADWLALAIAAEMTEASY